MADLSEQELERRENPANRSSDSVHSQFGGKGGVYGELQAIRAMQSNQVSEEFCTPILIADAGTKVLTGGVQEKAELQPETTVVDTPKEQPHATQEQWAQRLEQFAHSRFATPTLDGNAMHLSDNWEDSYRGEKTSVHGIANDFTVQHQVQVDQRTGQVLGYGPDRHLANNRPIGLNLPDEVIPMQPGDETQVSANLKVQGSNEVIPYRAVIGRGPDGEVLVKGQYYNSAHRQYIPFNLVGHKAEWTHERPAAAQRSQYPQQSGDSGF